MAACGRTDCAVHVMSTAIRIAMGKTRMDISDAPFESRCIARRDEPLRRHRLQCLTQDAEQDYTLLRLFCLRDRDRHSLRREVHRDRSPEAAVPVAPPPADVHAEQSEA